MTPMSSDKTTNREIVGAFLRASGISINEGDICDADEPLPDVLCTFLDGTRVAFELTEAVDQNVAGTVKASPKSEAQIRMFYDCLPPAQHTKLRETLGNAYISIRAKEGTTEREFERVIPAVFKLLLDCSRVTEGELEAKSLPGGIEEICTARGKWSSGPFFAHTTHLGGRYRDQSHKSQVR